VKGEANLSEDTNVHPYVAQIPVYRNLPISLRE
jgi:hypothetical protein